MAVNPLKLDPTQTITLRKTFERDLTRRFNKLKRKLRELLVTEDALGLVANMVANKDLSVAMATVDDSVILKAIKKLQARLDPDDVLKIEDIPHVTVRYGFLEDSLESVKLIAEQYSKIGGRLGKLSLFENEGVDVLKFDVDSPRLHDLHGHLGIIPSEDTYQEYQPHLTVAYLKPGTGKYYVDQLVGLRGREFLLKEIVFSTPDEETTKILLNAYNPNQPRDSRGRWGSGGGSGGTSVEGLTKVVEGEVTFETGKPVEFNSARNLESSPKASAGDTFQQKIEPAGRYLLHQPNPEHTPPGWEKGRVEFKKPLVLQDTFGDQIYDETSWKKRLSTAYGGKTGKSLSKAVAKDGYDGIVTTVKGHSETREIVDLRMFRVDNSLAANARWEFLTSAEKLESFKVWLATAIQADILLGASGTEGNYWAKYIEQGYRKGAGRAFTDVKIARRAEALAERSGSEYLQWYEGTREQFLQSAFGQPVAKEKVQLLASRVFTDLKGVTDTMSTSLARTLADGMVEGKNPRAIAKDIMKQVDGIGIRRAHLISRTEIIRSHAQGQLRALEMMGVEKVGVAVEWSTAGDSRVCKRCQALEGVVLTIKEAQGLIPVHPACRCSFLPSGTGESTEGQVRSQAKIKAAIDKSIKAEIPKKSKRTLAQQKALTKWGGADKRIAKKRPKSIV